MGAAKSVQQCLEAAGKRYATANPKAPLRAAQHSPQTLWCKLDHLLYLPILDLSRPSELAYYQGDGLKVLWGFTCKYLTAEHFLGELTRMHVAGPLAEDLAACYSQAWYPGGEPLDIFIDWHSKPLWTKYRAHANHIAMWGRVMPGTKQLFANGPGGHLLWAWDAPVDSHFNGWLVQLEDRLEGVLGRRIACSLFDSEGGSLGLAQCYAQAGRSYLTVLSGGWQYSLEQFQVLGEWVPVAGDSAHEAVEARWKDAVKAREDPRRLILMRRYDGVNPTRIYAGCLPGWVWPGEIPGRFRKRWPYQERVFRELVNGANLNANYGYTAQDVPDRTQQRRFEEAQGRVEFSEKRLAQHQEGIRNLQRQMLRLRERRHQEQASLNIQAGQGAAEKEHRTQAGLPTAACERRLEGVRQRMEQSSARYRQQRERQLRSLRERREKARAMSVELAERRSARDGIDTTGLCRERDLEKDQLMLNLQVLLGSINDWARMHYLAPEWRHLELKAITQLIYRKRGRVTWGKEEIVVTLEGYDTAKHQRLMDESCARLNARAIRWHDGRRITIRVAAARSVQSRKSTAWVQG